MKALVATGADRPLLELRDVPEPEPARGEALVEVRALSLNRGECARLPGAEPAWRPGWDVAGVVAEPAAGGTGPAAGTRVATWVAGGGWAERVAVPADRLGVLPDGISLEQASTLPVAGLTALRTLRLGGLLLGRRVLVTGAAGGVGRFAVQLARRAGAHVTALAAGPGRAEGLRELGADAVAEAIEELEGPFDLVLESVGGASLAHAIRLVAARGTVVSFGWSSREPTTFDAAALYRTPHVTVRGFLVFDREPVPYADDLVLLARLVAAGELRAEVGLEAPWTEADRAVRALLARQVRGKAVLRIGS